MGTSVFNIKSALSCHTKTTMVCTIARINLIMDEPNVLVQIKYTVTYTLAIDPHSYFI